MAVVDFASVPGNDELKRRLAHSIREGSLGHAYILEGPGIIRSFAVEIAKAALCMGHGALPCGECASCRKIDAGSHPDVRIVGRGDRASVGVDVIRSVRADAHVIPSESERKVYIIEDADTMTVEAQNAFLLTLEEPPPYVLYLLLCSRSEALLETVRSRAASLRCRPCRADEIGEYVLSVGGARARSLRDHDRSLWDELITIACGDPGRAAELLEGNTLDERVRSKRQTLSLLSSILSLDDEALVTVASMKKTKRAEAAQMTEDMEAALRDMLLSKKMSSFDTLFFASAEDAASAAERFPARKLALSLDAVRECSAALERNAAVTTAMLSMTINIRNT